MLRRLAPGSRPFLVAALLAALLPGGHVAAAAGGPATLPGVVARRSVPTSPVAVAVDATTERVFVDSAGAGLVSVLDESTLQTVASLPAGAGALAHDPGLGRLYLAGPGGIGVEDEAGNSVPVGFTLAAPPSSLAVDPSTHVLYVGETWTSRGDLATPGQVQAFDAQSGRLLATGIIGSSPTDAGLRTIGPIAVDSTSHALFVVSSRKYADSWTVTMLDGTTLRPAATRATGGTTSDVAVDPATHLVFVSAASSVIELDGSNANFAEVRRIPISYNPGPLAVDPSLHLVYVANGGPGPFPPLPVPLASPTPPEDLPSAVLAIDERSGQVVLSVPFQMTSPTALAVDPSRHLAFTIGRDDNAIVGVQGLTATPGGPHDDRYFAQTGYRIDDDVIWSYFNRRGGLATFGYPVSRTFRFQGHPVQLFQRRAVEIGPDGQARLLNLLDPGIMPYASYNGATFPSFDAALVASAPSATAARAILAFVKAHAPDEFHGMPVGFYRAFSNTVAFPVAFPGGGDPGLLPGVDLEVWGIPTSDPQFDPNNHNVVYLRFQRGIVQYNAECRCTLGILLADYLKSILTGNNLPPDLDLEARGSPFYRQYDPSAPHWVHNPAVLPDTDLTDAFVPE